MTVQLPLELELEPTIAMRRGEQWIEQCAQCGLVAVVTSVVPIKRLGPCPECGGDKWWPQQLPVAGLK